MFQLASGPTNARHAGICMASGLFKGLGPIRSRTARALDSRGLFQGRYLVILREPGWFEGAGGFL